MVAIRELDRLEEVEMDWRELAESRSNAFLTPEWAGCWFKHYGAGFEPLVVAVRADGGRVRGLLPMALSASGRPRIATLIGANLGDRFHPVCKPGEEPEVAAAAGEALAAWVIHGARDPRPRRHCRRLGRRTRGGDRCSPRKVGARRSGPALHRPLPLFRLGRLPGGSKLQLPPAGSPVSAERSPGSRASVP